jgi:type I restriction enzyme S subunit
MNCQLPNGWTLASLDQVTEPATAVDPRKRGQAFNYIDVSAIAAGKIGNGQSLEAERAPSGAKQLVKLGDTLFSGVRVYLKNIALVDDAHDGSIASTAFCVLRPRAAVDPRYLYFFVNSQKFIGDLLPLQRGNSPPAVLDSDIKAQPIPIAPLNEQRRIVARIDELFAEIDEGEAALDRARQGLDTWRRALLKAAVTGELTRDWREANRPAETGADLLARIRAERTATAQPPGRRRQQVHPIPINAGSLPTLPAGWVWASLGELFDVTTGSTPSRAQPSYWGGTIPWVSSGEVAFCRIKKTRECITAAALRGSSNRIHPPGTVLLAMIGEGKTRGQCAILDIAACNNQNSAAIRVGSTPIQPQYIYYVLQERYYRSRKESQGGNQPALNAGKVASMVIALPPLAEIREIVRQLDDFLDLGETAEHGYLEADTDRLRLRQSILRTAFEGRLVPQDPTDEPASALLARSHHGNPQMVTLRRRARAIESSSHPSLPGLAGQSLDPRVEPASGD